MPINELVGEMRAAAASLVTAAGAAEHGDLAAAEIGVEDALFRVQSLLGRLRQAQIDAEVAPPPTTLATGHTDSRAKAPRLGKPSAGS
jgi:hypothetical protein